MLNGCISAISKVPQTALWQLYFRHEGVESNMKAREGRWNAPWSRKTTLEFGFIFGFVLEVVFFFFLIDTAVVPILAALALGIGLASRRKICLAATMPHFLLAWQSG